MTRLQVLGPVELRTPDGGLEHSFLAGPKRLALLTYLVLSRPRGLRRRDALLPFFWPEKNQKQARNALSNMLYHMRRALGPDTIVARGREELGVDPEALWCDALELEAAAHRDDPARVVELYRGELLHGFHVPDASPDFDRWLEQERRRLRSAHGEALETLAERAHHRGAPDEAARWWRKRTRQDPLDAHATARLMECLAVAGNRAEALEVADRHARLLDNELGAAPGDEITELARRLQAGTPGKKVPTRPFAPPKKGMDSLDPLTIAVLPFEGIGEGREGALLAGGLHHDLLTRLSRVGSLTVISRTSVLPYRDTAASIPEIARTLGAGTILEGGVQQAGDRVRLNVQLIDARSDRHRWAETYDRELTADNLFELQSELAERITESLRATLKTREERRAMRWKPTDDLDAYRLHAHGREHLEERTEEGMRRALEHFRQATDRDPDYALAWVGMADALTLLHEYGFENEGEDALGRAAEAVDRALELDPSSGEAHASLGLLHEARHDGPSAVRELNRAVELQPSYAEAYNWMSWTYLLLGEGEQGLASARRAVELDPLSSEAVCNLSLGYIATGDPVQAVSEGRRAAEIRSDWDTPDFYEAVGHFHLGNFREVRTLLKGRPVAWAGSGSPATYALACIGEGDLAEGRKALARFEASGDRFAVGVLLAALGEHKRALTTLMGVEDWDYWALLSIHHFYPGVWEPLRDDPRHAELVRRAKASRGV